MKKEADQIMQVAQQVAELRGVVVKGFEGVHQRQDITNGRIAKAEARLEKLETAQNVDTGERQGISLAWKVFLSIASIVIGILTIIYFK